MRNFTIIFSAVAFTFAAATTQAGGLSPEIMERPVVKTDTLAPSGPSIEPTYVILGILAALLIAAAINANDDDDEPTAVMAETDPEPATLMLTGEGDR